jgi:hypothetical protein
MYQQPGGPNMGALRLVMPREAWDALSCGPSYASTSIIIAAIVLFPTRRTKNFPSKSRATASVGRFENFSVSGLLNFQ